MAGQAGSKQDDLLCFPFALPPFDQPERLFILAKGGFAHGPAIIRSSDGRWVECGQARDEDRIVIAAFVLWRANHTLAGRSTEAMRAEHGGHVASGARRRLPRPEVLAQLLHPAMVADLGYDLIPATEQPVEHLGRAKAPVEA